jgi:hypothetical protein
MLEQVETLREDPLFKKGLLAIKSSGKKTKIKSNYPIPADYRMPQALHQLGALIYSPQLLQIIESDTQIEKGSDLESQIREASIEACNIIAKNNNLSPHQVDDYLFGIVDKSKKHHLVRTTWY